MRAEIRDKRIDTDRDGSRWFRCEVVVLGDEGEELQRRNVQRALDNHDCDTPCIQQLVDEHRDAALQAARNAARIDIEAIS